MNCEINVVRLEMEENVVFYFIWEMFINFVTKYNSLNDQKNTY